MRQKPRHSKPVRRMPARASAPVASRAKGAEAARRVAAAQASAPHWDRRAAVARLQPKVQQYLAITRELLAELAAARQALAGKDVTADAPAPEWDRFCDEIGISRTTAEKWLQRYGARPAAERPATPSAPAPAAAPADPARASTAGRCERTECERRLESIERLCGVLAQARSTAAAAPEVLTLVEAAAFLRCPPALVGRLVRKGDLQASMVGHDARFLRADLVTWLREHGVSGEEAAAAVIAEADAQPSLPGLSPAPEAAAAPVAAAGNGSNGNRAATVGRGAKLSDTQRETIKKRILRDLRAGRGIMDAARDAGIAWATLHIWRRQDAAFSQAIQEVRGW